MAFYSHVAWSLCVAYDVIIVLASVGLIAGTVSRKRFFLVPWLTVVALSLLFCLVMVLAAAIGQGGGKGAFFILLVSAPVLAAFTYCWLVVYSTFHQMRGEEPKRGESRPESAPLVSTFSSAAATSTATTASVTDREILFLGGSNKKRISRRRAIREEEDEETSGGGVATASSCSIEDDSAVAAATAAEETLLPILENPSSSQAETTEDMTASLNEGDNISATAVTSPGTATTASPASAAEDDQLLLVTTAEVNRSASSGNLASSSSSSRRPPRKSSSSFSSSEVTPPPAYDAVREDIDKEKLVLASGLATSQDLIFSHERKMSKESIRSTLTSVSASLAVDHHQQQQQQQQQQRRPLLLLSNESSIESIKEENEEEEEEAAANAGAAGAAGEQQGKSSGKVTKLQKESHNIFPQTCFSRFQFLREENLRRRMTTTTMSWSLLNEEKDGKGRNIQFL